MNAGITSVTPLQEHTIPAVSLDEMYLSVRRQTEEIVSGMSAEDMQLQSMPDASPSKWHLAHTTWFFETFILNRQPEYNCFHPSYEYLFNSYYNSIGNQFRRPERGVLSRPDIRQILAYRNHVDEAMLSYLVNGHVEHETNVILLGIHHEQQHQELIYTDIKHAFSRNPMFPALIDRDDRKREPEMMDLEFISFDGGLNEIGLNMDDSDFCFDNETPAHKHYTDPFRLASRPITNSEFMEFIEDGGYQNPLLWLSDGWSLIDGIRQKCPAYWHMKDDGWFEYTLAGLRPLQSNSPVCHINYFEACAFATWAGKRLPTEFEWELAARQQPVNGNCLDMDVLHPRPADSPGLTQMFGDVWEWTCSAYAAYPGFKPVHGALGEYNGKFMCGQYVLRGGSCVTPQGHIRPSYRNFFYPGSYWQFSGIRLADDR